MKFLHLHPPHFCVLVITLLLRTTSSWGQSRQVTLLNKDVVLNDVSISRISSSRIKQVAADRHKRSVNHGTIKMTIENFSSTFQPGLNTQTRQMLASLNLTSDYTTTRTYSFDPSPVITASPDTTLTSEPLPETTVNSITTLTPEPLLETIDNPDTPLTALAILETIDSPDTTLTSEPLPETTVNGPSSETQSENEPESEYIGEPDRFPTHEPNSIPEPEGNPEPELGMNISSEPNPEPGPSVKRDLFVIVLSVLILLILVTNITLTLTILKTKTLRKPTNVMILSLAFADISIACFVIPGVISGQFSEMWMAIIICKICHFASHMSSAAASFSLVAIALDRLRAIALPLKPKLSMSESAVIVALIWFLSTLYGLRASFLFTLSPVDVLDDFGQMYTEMVCGVPDSESETNSPLIVLDFTIVFALPALTILVSYVGLLYFLSKNTLKTQFYKPETKRGKKALKLSILMISMFIICHLPVHSLRLYISSVSSAIPQTFDMIRAFDIISFLNSILDPIVYGILNKQIRDGFLERIGKPKVEPVKLAHNRIHPGGSSVVRDVGKISTVVDKGAKTSVTPGCLST